jgi:hypothetical protein
MSPGRIPAESSKEWALLRDLWFKVFVAANRVAALAITVFLHQALEALMKWLLQGESLAQKVMSISFLVPFLLVWIHLAVELLTTFVPVQKYVEWFLKGDWR